MRRGRVAAAVAVLLASAGCGLRVDGARAAATGAPGLRAGAAVANIDTGAVAGAAGGSPAGGGALRPASTAQAGAVPGAAGTTAAAGVGGRVGVGVGVGAGIVLGRGVTSTTITIGLQVSKNLQAGYQTVGASGKAPDEKSTAEALVRWVNETGGIAGRRLAAVIHETDPTSGTWSSQAEAACQDFTEDHHVFAVGSSRVGGSDYLLTCLARHNTPDIEQNVFPFDDVYYRRYPTLLYQPGRASATQWAKAYVDGLDAAGFFKGATVGLVRFDSPVFQRLAHDVLDPELTRRGYRVTKEIAVSEPQSAGDLAGMAAQLNQAIITLRAAGVDHVIWLETAGEAPFFMLSEAESQNYRPTYGFSSNDVPSLQTSQAPAAQLRNAVAVGWVPDDDVAAPADNAAARSCRAVMNKYGVAVGSFADSFCDTVMFLRTVMPQVREFTPEGLRAAVDRLGTAYVSPLTHGTKLGPGRHSGAAFAQLARFQEGCGCFRYTGSRFAM